MVGGSGGGLWMPEAARCVRCGSEWPAVPLGGSDSHVTRMGVGVVDVCAHRAMRSASGPITGGARRTRTYHQFLSHSPYLISPQGVRGSLCCKACLNNTHCDCFRYLCVLYNTVVFWVETPTTVVWRGSQCGLLVRSLSNHYEQLSGIRISSPRFLHRQTINRNFYKLYTNR